MGETTSERLASQNLPSLQPSAVIVLRRTQTTLGLLRNVVQESLAEYWYELGKAASAAENHPEASANFRACIARDNHHWRSMLQLATLSIRQQKVAAALLILQAQDLFLDRHNYEYSNEFTKQLLKSEWHLLRNEFKSYEGLPEDELNIRLALVITFCALEKPKLARKAMKEMKYLFSNQIKESALWHSISGTLWLNSKYSRKESRYKKSLADLEQAIKIAPEYPAAYCRMAESIGFSAGRQEAGIIAIENYTQAIRIDPFYAAAFHNRGYVKKHIGDLPGAIADYSQAIKLDSKYTMAYYDRGRANIEMNNYKEAVHDYRDAIALDKSDSFWGKLAPGFMFIYEKRRTSEILLIYDILVELKPDFATSYNYRADVKSFFGDKKGAISDYSRAIGLDGDNERIYFNRGKEKSALGDKKGAIDDYSHAIEINSEDDEYYHYRGISKYESNDKIGAIADFDRAIALENERALYYKNRGLVKGSLGDTAGATADRQKAEEISAK